jgi:hypothetical protein
MESADRKFLEEIARLVVLIGQETANMIEICYVPKLPHTNILGGEPPIAVARDKAKQIQESVDLIRQRLQQVQGSVQ